MPLISGNTITVSCVKLENWFNLPQYIPIKMLLLEEMRYCGHNIPVACCVYLLKNIQACSFSSTYCLHNQTDSSQDQEKLC